MSAAPEYPFLGSFDLHAAQEICGLLEGAGIDFQLEIDDMAIRNMLPFEAAMGGTYGTGVMAAIYIDPSWLEHCYQILEARDR